VSTTTEKSGSQGPGLLVRILWFVFLGWWLAGLANVIGYLLCLTIVGLPAGFMLFNRIPSILTLRPRTIHTTTTIGDDGIVHVSETIVTQRNFFLRALWFLVIGWWFGAIWSVIAFTLCVLVITLPFGVMAYNRLPAVMTLRRY
jgi:uncharacterized membrane protein YccF (DUF307 family)